MGFVIFHYTTINKFAYLRTAVHDSIGTDIFDDMEAVLLSLVLIYFIAKKHHLLLNAHQTLAIENKELLEKIDKMHNTDKIEEERLKELKQLILSEPSKFYPIFKKHYPVFIHKLVERAPNLVLEEMNIIALLKLNFATKEIALITNSTIRAIEGKKYRIRKKLNVPHEMDLTMFLHTV